MELCNAYGAHILAYQERVRIRLCNEWDLVQRGSAEGFADYYREEVQSLVRTLPVGREIEPTDRDVEEPSERWDLCSEWDLVPAEQMRLDNFICEMALVEIRRRVKAGNAGSI